jgi:hypothetical protein
MPLEHALIDLDIVRDAQLIEWVIRKGREQVNRDQITSFTWVTLDECDSAGAVKELSFGITGWRLSGKRTEIPWGERTDDWVCADCRANVAMRDGVCGACWLTRWKKAGGMSQYA